MATSLSQHIQIWPVKSLLYDHITLQTHTDPNRASDLPSLWLIHSHTHTHRQCQWYFLWLSEALWVTTSRHTHTANKLCFVRVSEALFSLAIWSTLCHNTHIHRQTQQSPLSMAIWSTEHHNMHTDRQSQHSPPSIASATWNISSQQTHTSIKPVISFLCCCLSHHQSVMMHIIMSMDFSHFLCSRAFPVSF